MWTVKQAREKLETELLFLKDSWLKRPFSLRNDIQNRYSNDFARKTKQKKLRKLYFRCAIKFTYLYSLPLTWKVEHKGGKRPKTSLRETSIQKYEIAQNCPFPPSLPLLFPTVIAFHRVKKSSLIIGIV